MRRKLLLVLTVIVTLVTSWVSAPAGERANQISLRVGMIRTLFRDIDERFVIAQLQPMGELLRLQMGIGVTFQVEPDEKSMAQHLQEGQIQLGLLHGVEYGWARKQSATIQPLVLLYNQTTDLKAYVLVNRDNPAKEFADLRGQRLIAPRRGLNHMHMFLNQCVEECRSSPPQFFGTIQRATTTDAALDEVVDGKADTVVMDGLGLEVYQQRKPGRAAKLRVLKESVVFPTAVVVYQPGRVDEAALTRVRGGMLSAHQSRLGRQLLTLGRVSGFLEVPPQYEQRVQDILKVFPGPQAEARAQVAEPVKAR